MNNEITLSSEKIFEGKIIKLRIDTVELPNKKYKKREIVEHNGAVAILAITNKNEIILVKQFRKAAEDFLLELPAGKIESNEKSIDCAKRELKEETGFEAKKIEKVCEFYTSPGFCTEKIFLYKAIDLVETGIDLDEDEFIELLFVSFDEAKEMIKTGKIIDSKTIIGILSYSQI